MITSVGVKFCLSGGLFLQAACEFYVQLSLKFLSEVPGRHPQ